MYNCLSIDSVMKDVGGPHFEIEDLVVTDRVGGLHPNSDSQPLSFPCPALPVRLLPRLPAGRGGAAHHGAGPLDRYVDM